MNITSKELLEKAFKIALENGDAELLIKLARVIAQEEREERRLKKAMEAEKRREEYFLAKAKMLQAQAPKPRKQKP